MNDETLLQSIDEHFQMGSPDLDFMQLAEHKRRLSCPFCDERRIKLALYAEANTWSYA